MNEVDAEIAAGFADSYRRIERMIKRIPRGRRAARIVGYAIHKTYPFVPWHRVLGKRAKNTAQVAFKDALWGARQRDMLEAEGVQFSASASVDFETYGFHLGIRVMTERTRTKSRNRK